MTGASTVEVSCLSSPFPQTPDPAQEEADLRASHLLIEHPGFSWFLLLNAVMRTFSKIPSCHHTCVLFTSPVSLPHPFEEGLGQDLSTDHPLRRTNSIYEMTLREEETMIPE